jgi:hypothetical protein
MSDFMTPRGHMANLVALTKSATPFGEVGVCPLTKTTVQLLPVRYALVEEGLDPSADMAMPFTLQSRPLGLRLMRDGFLYVLDNTDGIMRDYGIKDGSLDDEWPSTSAHPKPLGNPTKMIFSRRTVLYVAYSEVQWTTDKCHQVMNDMSEREQFMQRIDLSQAHSENIVAPLIHERHAKKWLAEVVRDHQPPQDGINAKENLPYLWESPPLFRQTLIEELTSQIHGDQQKDFLFLAVRDDIGVMRDLASYQNKVVGWIDEWAQSGEQEGDTERDYLLACYIESLSQISAANLNEMAQRTDDPALKALLLDLDKLPEPTRGHTRQALLDALSLDPTANPLPGVSDPNHPPDLEAQLQQIRLGANQANGYSVLAKLESAVDLYYLKRKLVAADPDFVFTHWQTLSKLHREQDKRLRDLLYGARFGQRGINDLIDRPRMDAFLAEQRPKLAHWNALLDRITEDRLQMVVNNRFQRAAWFYDTRLPDQVDHALLTQYDCLKDICRSDVANDRILAWLNANPQQSRPLFYTLPNSVQTELAAQFAQFINAGYGLLKNAPESIEELRAMFASHLPDIETQPHATQVNASAAWGTLSPAVQSGVQQALQDFMQALDKGQMPDIDQLFRTLPNTFAVSLLDAARREKVSFQIADADELKALGELVKEVQSERRHLRYLNNNARQYRKQRDHWRAQEQESQRPETQRRLAVLEQQLAQALSPIPELPEGAVHLHTATSAKPGLALVFPPDQQVQVRSLIGSYRQGLRVAPAVGLLGDGAGLLVFAAQLVNLLQIWREMRAQTDEQIAITPLLSSLFTTATAGFGAAQGIADTALNAQAAQLARNLKAAELKGVHIQMGKLHLGLGAVGYIAGAIAAAMSLNSAHNNWLNAAREGNGAAQVGATLNMIGNSGFLLSNTYGLGETWMAGRNVLATARQTEARLISWAAAGTRLSKVFFHFNLAGILFTALDLSGTWFYNRHNLSRHDRWLEMTPWSQNSNKRLSLSLIAYQKNLHTQIKAPRIEVHPQQRDDQGPSAATRIALHLPTTTLSELMRPFGVGPAKTVLRIGSYDLRTHLVRPKSVERWTVSTDALIKKLWIRQTAPLILEFEAPTHEHRPAGTESDELVITVELGDFLPDKNHFELTNYHYRIPLNGFAGEILDNKLEHQGDKCTFYWVDPYELAQEDQGND